MTSIRGNRGREPLAPPKPADEIETSRTVAVGFFMERMKMEQAGRVDRTTATVAAKVCERIMRMDSARPAPLTHDAYPLSQP